MILAAGGLAGTVALLTDATDGAGAAGSGSEARVPGDGGATGGFPGADGGRKL
jgi:hypothetical protein